VLSLLRVIALAVVTTSGFVLVFGRAATTLNSCCGPRNSLSVSPNTLGEIDGFALAKITGIAFGWIRFQTQTAVSHFCEKPQPSGHCPPKRLVNSRWLRCAYGVISLPMWQCGWPKSWGNSPTVRYWMLSAPGPPGVPSNPARWRMR
jgi:hypothetical protein